MDADKELAKKTVYKVGIIGFIIMLIIHLSKGYFGNDFKPWLKNLLDLTPEFVGAFCIWLFGLYIWEEIKKQDEQLKNQNQLAAIKETIQKSLPSLKNSGIIEFHSTIPSHEKFVELLKNVNNKIYILQTWMEDITALKPHIVDAAKRNVEIKILVLKTNSHQLVSRANSIPIPIEEATNRLSNTIKEIKRISQTFNNVKLLEYDDLLSMSAYIIDDNCFIGWYWKGKEGKEANNRNKPYLQILGRGTELYESVNEHFDNVWNEAEANNSGS